MNQEEIKESCPLAPLDLPFGPLPTCFDASGNQAEWCQDWLAAYGGNLAVDPTGPLNGELRVPRGGNFGSQATRIRSAAREGRLPSSPKDGSLCVVRAVVEN